MKRIASASDTIGPAIAMRNSAPPLSNDPLSVATPPNSQSVIPSISTPSRRAWSACPSSCRSTETKKRTAATNAIAMCVPSPRSGFVRGKTPVESVHTKSAKTTSQLQWMLIRMPAIRPIAKLEPILTSLSHEDCICRRGCAADMADNAFEHPRLAAIYDALDPDRSDLDVYVAIADELGARRVLDVGCGTGTFALLLAERGLEVTGVDPAGASLDVARAKPGAERVRWIHGDATALPPLEVDLATMTANVAQAIVDPADWDGTLRGVHDALRPGGHLVFETRDPAARAWEEWNRPASYSVTEIEGDGAVESWYELIDVSLPLISFRGTCVFPDGEVLTSDSTLRFRERDEVEAALVDHGYVVDEVRDAPDRPGREFVFFARRPE